MSDIDKFIEKHTMYTASRIVVIEQPDKEILKQILVKNVGYTNLDITKPCTIQELADWLNDFYYAERLHKLCEHTGVWN